MRGILLLIKRKRWISELFYTTNIFNGLLALSWHYICLFRHTKIILMIKPAKNLIFMADLKLLKCYGLLKDMKLYDQDLILMYANIHTCIFSM